MQDQKLKYYIRNKLELSDHHNNKMEVAHLKAYNTTNTILQQHNFEPHKTADHPSN